MSWLSLPSAAMRPSFVKRSNVTLYDSLAIQEADELDAAVVDEAGADERLAEDRVAPEGGGLGPEPGLFRPQELGGDVVDGDTLASLPQR